MDISNIRNFVIIAHIDHGKSTLCDRFLEITETVNKRELKEQTLDQMDLEREKGITIKLQPVKMKYVFEGQSYELNLIDTPGHVDFNYEVSRSLAAVEGAILLVDASQGIQAQTLANLYLALETDLTIIPVINKIDLPNANVSGAERAILDLVGGRKEDILRASGKTGEGVGDVLAAVIRRINPPQDNRQKRTRALIFDSYYDSYKGVIAYVRVFDGAIREREEIFMVGTKKKAEAIEVGIFKPKLESSGLLSSGSIGYVATGLKSVSECRVGDTIVNATDAGEISALVGYKKIKPIVFASFYPREGEDYNRLRDALDKLSLNDASFEYWPESSLALGRGFRGGFLGLLHMEIIQERLQREFDLDLIFTIPSVEFKVKLKGKKELVAINSPLDLPDVSTIDAILEPWAKLEIITNAAFIGNIMEHMGHRRSQYLGATYLEETRAILNYETPLSEIITNLHDAIKAMSQGYASINYEFISFRESDLVRLNILIAGEVKEELTRIVPREKSRKIALRILKKLKETLDRQNFAITLQAAIGGKVIAREDIKAVRKDVLAKLYGGDRTRKDKLLKKQKKGKKLLKEKGRVSIPAKAYLEIMKD